MAQEGIAASMVIPVCRGGEDGGGENRQSRHSFMKECGIKCALGIHQEPEIRGPENGQRHGAR